MSDNRSHRGPHPDDASLFTAQTLPILRHAVSDMSWLLSRGYADKSGLKLVGDRYGLTQRQRLAVMRSSCSDSQVLNRLQKRILPSQISVELIIDGYNLLITTEAALSGAMLFVGRDECVRDLASIHGTYRKVKETLPAIGLIAEVLNAMGIAEVLWLLDRPVSNSGRLRNIILSVAESKGLRWDVQLLGNPDKALIETNKIIATSDSMILDHCQRWLNLSFLTVEAISTKQDIRLFDLRDS